VKPGGETIFINIYFRCIFSFKIIDIIYTFRVETVRVLMESVASDEAKKTTLTMTKNSEDKTAWDIAAGAKNQAVCTVLKELGDSNGASSSCIIS
jgi:hypothetical protein